MTGVPAARDSIITRPKGSGQSLGNSVAAAPAKKLGFWRSSSSPTKVASWTEQRLDLALEVLDVHRVDLGGDVQRSARAPGDLDGQGRALLGADAPDEREVLAGRATRWSRSDRGRGRCRRWRPTAALRSRRGSRWLSLTETSGMSGYSGRIAWT